MHGVGGHEAPNVISTLNPLGVLGRETDDPLTILKNFFVGLFETIVSNPLYLLGFVLFLVLLILLLTIRYIQRIRGEEIWLH